ncbi:ADP-ribosylglycohydrolase family protein [Breznakiella homolactica]|uniref:ADP-ribosylglycohydrolase family protein n=1 Tax=Breznakiella homolactica TaxID=2798577 RepID=A0A7T7XLJ9_9SPIR|nr:ADP-ribosylglycohydrolase family protein [Breznakiella homolactica]QQO08452.1 ADP-ribosylglycohydrolase family protein [Breznakiella homolactica]
METAPFERVAGSLYGMATGDALGVPTSFLTPEHIRRVWGWVDTFYPPEPGHIFHDGLTAGEFTDDTEQALALIKSFTRERRVVPEDVVREILAWAERVKDKYASPLGPSTERALKAIAAGAPVTESGKWGNTNGSAMRISPVGIIHGLRGSSCEELVRDVYLTCLPTHNTTVCVSAAAAVAWGVACCIRGEHSVQTIVEETMRAADLGKQFGHEIPAASISARIAHIHTMIAERSSDEQAAADIYALFAGGDLAADSIPVAIGLFELGKGDPKRVNELCVNFGGDCDTNAAMAGAMAGAFAGIEAVPAEWRETVRTVNKVNLEQYARDLITLAPEWKTGEIQP